MWNGFLRFSGSEGTERAVTSFHVRYRIRVTDREINEKAPAIRESVRVIRGGYSDSISLAFDKPAGARCQVPTFEKFTASYRHG